MAFVIVLDFDTDVILELKFFRGTSWVPRFVGSFQEEGVETTTGAFPSQEVVDRLKLHLHADVGLVSTIRLGIAYVDARADSRITMVKDVETDKGLSPVRFVFSF